MALRDLIRREVQKALTYGGPLDDLPTQVLYTPLAWLGAFNPATQEVGASQPPKTVDVVFVQYESKDVDGVNVLPADEQVLMADLNRLAAGLPVPDSDDQLIESRTGSLWTVVAVTSDPAQACYVLQVRHP